MAVESSNSNERPRTVAAVSIVENVGQSCLVDEKLEETRHTSGSEVEYHSGPVAVESCHSIEIWKPVLPAYLVEYMGCYSLLFVQSSSSHEQLRQNRLQLELKDTENDYQALSHSSSCSGTQGLDPPVLESQGLE